MLNIVYNNNMEVFIQLALLTAFVIYHQGTLVSSNNKSDCHNITEILFKVALNMVTP